MTKSFLAALAWVLVFGLHLAAAAGVTEVRDPQNLLGQLDDYLGKPSFTSSYCVGDTAQFDLVNKDCYESCGGDGCGMVCEALTPPPVLTSTVTKLVPATATAPLTAVIALEDGSTMSAASDVVTTENGNRVREEIAHAGQQFGVDGYAEAVLLQDRPYQLASGETLNAKEIVFDFHPKGFENAPFKIRYSVMQGYPAVAQIVRMAASGQWIYQMDSMKRGACSQ